MSVRVVRVLIFPIVPIPMVVIYVRAGLVMLIQGQNAKVGLCLPLLL